MKQVSRMPYLNFSGSAHLHHLHTDFCLDFLFPASSIYLPLRYSSLSIHYKPLLRVIFNVKKAERRKWVYYITFLCGFGLICSSLFSPWTMLEDGESASIMWMFLLFPSVKSGSPTLPSQYLVNTSQAVLCKVLFLHGTKFYLHKI